MPQPTGEAIRAQLERILASEDFARSPRLARFLRYAVEETLAGRATDIKELSIALSVYDRGPDFDPRSDSTVRTEAGRLRTRLTQYYLAAGVNDPVEIGMPRGSYVPVFAARAQAPAAEPRPREKTVWYVAAGLVAALAAAVAGWTAPWRTAPAPVTLTPLTTLPGSETGTSFSPDGQRFAFAWSGEQRENWDIWIAAVDGGSRRRVTASGAHDNNPSWSPDGARLAFVRDPGDGGQLMLLRLDDGGERELARHANGYTPAWAPDGRTLFYPRRESTAQPYRICSVDVASGAVTAVTDPSGEGSPMGDVNPAVSPDGRRLAFVRWAAPPASEIAVMDLPDGPPRVITSDRRTIFGIAWTLDGRDIIFSSDRHGESGLWRIGASGGAPPKPVPLASDGAIHPAIGRRPGGGARLAFKKLARDSNIWRLDTGGGEPTPVAASSRWELTPRVSPRGDRIAFASDRSGGMEIWTSASDGSGPARVTNIPGAYSRLPTWSADGKWLAFDSRTGGQPGDIYVVPSGGGQPRRLTSSTADEVRPFWSPDGTAVYFRSNQSGGEEIWKAPVAGGDPTQVTRRGAFEAAFAPDGRALYLTKRSSPDLWRHSLQTGEEEVAVENVRRNCWAVAETGIFWIDLDRPFAAAGSAVKGKPFEFYSFATRRKTRAGFTTAELLADNPLIDVSRDARSIYWAQVDQVNSDLMMLDPFE